MMGRHRESQTEEWKREWRDEMLHTVSAFANGYAGGKIIIGKDDKGEITGVSEKEEKKLLSSLPTKIKNIMGFYPIVESVTADGKTCVIITIEPQKIPVSYSGQYYKRSGSSSVAISGVELFEFLLKKKGLTWPDLISNKVKLKDISPEAVSAFVKRGQKVNRISSAADPDDTEGVLRQYGLMTDEGITNAAAVLFGKNPSFASYAAVTKIGLFAKEGGRLLMEDIIDGPVIFQPEETLKRLIDRYTQPRFRLEDHLTRIEVYRYPPEALREALLNAVIHRSHTRNQQTTVRVYPDSVEICNPGKLPDGWTAKDLKMKHKSMPANPLIAKIFYDMGQIEAWGVGCSFIREECEKAGNPLPVYEIDDDGIKIIFRSGPWSDTGEEATAQVRLDGLTPSEIRVYGLISEGSLTTRAELSAASGFAEDTVKKAISTLTKRGLILRIGSDKSGRWIKK